MAIQWLYGAPTHRSEAKLCFVLAVRVSIKYWSELPVSIHPVFRVEACQCSESVVPIHQRTELTYSGFRVIIVTQFPRVGICWRSQSAYTDVLSQFSMLPEFRIPGFRVGMCPDLVYTGVSIRHTSTLRVGSGIHGCSESINTGLTKVMHQAVVVVCPVSQRRAYPRLGYSVSPSRAAQERSSGVQSRASALLCWMSPRLARHGVSAARVRH